MLDYFLHIDVVGIGDCINEMLSKEIRDFVFGCTFGIQGLNARFKTQFKEDDFVVVRRTLQLNLFRILNLVKAFQLRHVPIVFE